MRLALRAALRSLSELLARAGVSLSYRNTLANNFL
ncbi:unnamed protein product [uncultured bacterium]|nr:unnamed protein product [uncultured bacterium]